MRLANAILSHYYWCEKPGVMGFPNKMNKIYSRWQALTGVCHLAIGKPDINCSSDKWTQFLFQIVCIPEKQLIKRLSMDCSD